MKRKLTGLAIWLVLLTVAGLLPDSSWALTDEEIFRDFRFNFVNPGARSLGMGGAFIAAGDDATAAQSNPAALHYVFKKEIFAEYRLIEPDTLLFRSKSVGDITDLANPTEFLELQAVNNRDDSALPSFLSYAHPFRLGSRRARFSVSRQIVLDNKSTLTDREINATTNLRFATQDYPVWVNPGDPNIHCGSIAGQPTVEQYTVCGDVNGQLDTELVNYNFGFSYSLATDFSLGVTATWATLDMTSDVVNTSQDPLGILNSVNPRVTTGSGVAPLVIRSSIDDSDGAFAYTLGLHWHPDSIFPSGISPIRFGLVYRKGPELSVAQTTVELDPNGVATPRMSFDNVLRVPDRVGLGVSYEMGEHWIFAVDAEHIEYSDLLEDFVPGVNFFTGGNINSPLFSVDPNQLEFDVDDATVIHAGVEYSFVSQGGWSHAIRAGYFNAPDNRIRLTEVNTGRASIDEIFKDVFRGGEDLSHYTVGFSLNTPAGLQIQLAADFSEETDEFLISTIYRFGRVN